MKCSRCANDATMKQGNQQLCDQHYRFGQMRSSAKRNGKIVPTHEQLEIMIGSEMLCPDCGVVMNWRSKDGKSTVASLQHYRAGTLAIVCLSCNTRHASMTGDSYCEMEKDHKQCPSCKSIKLYSAFSADNGRTGAIKRKSICKECSDKKVNQWKERNREQYNEYQRQYRATRKASGNPITR
jgi:hypothetical protein